MAPCGKSARRVACVIVGGGSGAVRGAAHSARRVNSLGHGEERGRRAAEARGTLRTARCQRGEGRGGARRGARREIRRGRGGERGSGARRAARNQQGGRCEARRAARREISRGRVGGGSRRGAARPVDWGGAIHGARRVISGDGEDGVAVRRNCVATNRAPRAARFRRTAPPFPAHRCLRCMHRAPHAIRTPPTPAHRPRLFLPLIWQQAALGVRRARAPPALHIPAPAPVSYVQR